MKRIAITLIVLLAACTIDGVQARKNAKAFSKEALGISGKPHITCQNTDSNRDGYVSCTVRDEAGEIYAIECSGALSMSNGCRMAMGNR